MQPQQRERGFEDAAGSRGRPAAGRVALLLPLLGVWLVAGPVAAGLSASQRQQALVSGRVSPEVVAGLERGASVPVIVSFGSPTEAAGDASQRQRAPDPAVRAARRVRRDALLRSLPARDFTLRHRYHSLSGMAGRVSPRGLLRLLEDPEVHVGPDEGGRGHLAQALPLAEVDAAQALGPTGAGITVALLDSGVDAGHVDIGAAVVAEQCFCSGGGGCCPGGGSTQAGAGAADDDHGHGTNTAGIVTSDGTTAPLGGAPDAEIVAVKVLDSNNGFCCSSDVIAGLDWILASQPDVDLVNLSLGTFATYAGDCDGEIGSPMLFAAAIDALRAQGVLVTVSSGNDGSTTDMSAPACVSGALSVAAVWDANQGSPQTFYGCTEDPTAPDLLSCWSNRNDRTDLLAPGAATTSTRMGGGTSTFRGTSQASPLVAACAALLLEENPALRPHHLEAALEASPTLIPDPLTPRSYPRLDCADALARTAPLDVPLPALALVGLSLLLVGLPLRQLLRR